MSMSYLMSCVKQQQKSPHYLRGGFALAGLREDYQARYKQGGEALLVCDAALSVVKLRITIPG